MLLSQVRQTARPHCTTGEHRDKRKRCYEGYHLCSVVGGRAFGRAAAPAAGETRAGDARHLPRDVQRHVLPDDVAARVRSKLGAAMNQEVELIEMALSISAAGGAVALAAEQEIEQQGAQGSLGIT